MNVKVGGRNLNAVNFNASTDASEEVTNDEDG